MINITKGREPASLREYRREENAKFDDIPRDTKRELRLQLLAEQGYICCYCMSRIEFDSSKIEHWLSQKIYPNHQLDYDNLLLACYGNEKIKGAPKHCDTLKDDDTLSLNPANIRDDVENKIRYLRNGVIESSDHVFNSELESVLNLNYFRLIENRKSTINGVIKILDKHRVRITKNKLQKYLVAWQTPDTDGKLKPFAGVATYYLKKRYRRA